MTKSSPHHSHHTTPHGAKPAAPSHRTLVRRGFYGAGMLAWVVGAFLVAQLVIVALVWGLVKLGFQLPFVLDETVTQTLVSIVVYALTIGLVLGVPWLIWRRPTTWRELGLAQSLPRWRDIGLAPIALIASLVVTGLVMYLAGLVFPGVDWATKQEVGFGNITQRYEMLLAFFTLVVLAPVAEELLFRGYLYSKVRQYYNAFWAILATASVFGFLHLYAGPGLPLQWNVVLGTGVLALFLGILREYTGSIWAGILLHMLKNGIAFFFLFVAPLLGLTLPQ